MIQPSRSWEGWEKIIILIRADGKDLCTPRASCASGEHQDYVLYWARVLSHLNVLKIEAGYGFHRLACAGGICVYMG